MNRFISIDEEGYFLSGGIRVTDSQYGHELFSHIKYESRTLFTEFNGQKIIVEAFDAPFVVRSITPLSNTRFKGLLPYDFNVEIDLAKLCVDEWDRFSGKTESGISYILNRAAQMQLFNMCDEFDDESLTIGGKKIFPTPLNDWDLNVRNEPHSVNEPKFWSERYKKWLSGQEAPPWERGIPSKTLQEIVPQLKLPKSRILALGCGTGHDAAYLAAMGHIVTGVDFSSEAIEKARQQHKNIRNLSFIHADAFLWSRENFGLFDIVYEHTFYCAVDPRRRHELVNLWRNLLVRDGHLLGIFYAFDRMGGPPYGASEWEIRERLKSHFDFLYWTRWKTTEEPHLGIELATYAQKKRGRLNLISRPPKQLAR